MMACECSSPHATARIVLTGGPGAGKTAVLELVRLRLCQHLYVLPEAAGVVFGGGFPREQDAHSRRAAQRAIFHIQRELEDAAESHHPAILLCDRGTLDGLAYWPGPVDEFFSSLRTSLEAELARYAAVIHLRTPGSGSGYGRQNPLRIESAAEAADIDRRILEGWKAHRRRFVIEPTTEFLDKAARTLDILRDELPECCRRHVVPTPSTTAALARGSS